MKNVFFLLSLLSFESFASALTDRIHSVVVAPDGTRIVRFAEGQVGFLSPGAEKSLMPEIDSLVRVNLDQRNEIQHLEIIERAAPGYDVYLKNSLLQEPPTFTPSVISMDKMNEIWKAMNPNFKRKSECSDRAHVWASDEFQRSGTMSQKAFIFFTASYINRNRFKWWFHVAPMFDVATGAGTQKMVMDVMYKDRPVTVKEWTDMMVFSGRDCKMTTKFSEYDVNPQTEDCYMIFESMYYRLPGDIHAQETTGSFRSGWNESEVNGARVRAFNVGRIQ